MSKRYCYLQTPRDLIKAEQILLDAGIEVTIRPVKEAVFGLCNMAIEIDKGEDIVYIVSILEAAGMLVTIKDDDDNDSNLYEDDDEE